MRDRLQFYINGKLHTVEGIAAFQPLSDYLRYGQGASGTKVVCAEGDCGACTVLLGLVNAGEIVYRPVNACIQYLYQLDGTHVITVEGLKVHGALNPVQEAMVKCHGAQCGYCTPGFIVAMTALQDDLLQHESLQKICPVTEQDVKNALTGNLCRCTGYEPILKAGVALNEISGQGNALSLKDLYPPREMLSDMAACGQEAVLLESEGRTFFKPVTVSEAVAFKAQHPNTTVISGGTDVSVFCNKRDFEPPVVMSTAHLQGLDEIELNEGVMSVGAKVTLSQLEAFVETLIPELHQILVVFGSPQIKNAGTLAGNIANGSPIGDSLPFLFVMDAEVELTGIAGSRRVNINQLYTGYRQLDMRPDEMITRILIPLPKADEVLKLYKVSKRKHLDISTFAAALLMKRNGEQIEDIRIAYGGVGPVVLRLPETEAFLTGKAFSEAVFQEAGEIAVREITPISDVRGSDRYRFLLAANILVKFYLEVSETLEAAAV